RSTKRIAIRKGINAPKILNFDYPRGAARRFCQASSHGILQTGSERALALHSGLPAKSWGMVHNFRARSRVTSAAFRKRNRPFSPFVVPLGIIRLAGWWSMRRGSGARSARDLDPRLTRHLRAGLSLFRP